MVVGATHQDAEERSADELCNVDAVVVGSVGVCIFPPLLALMLAQGTGGKHLRSEQQ